METIIRLVQGREKASIVETVDGFADGAHPSDDGSPMERTSPHRSHRGRRSGRHAVRGMDGGNVEKRQKDRRKRILRLFFLSSCHRLQRNSFSFHLVVQRDNLPFHLPPSLLAQKRHRLSLTGSFYLFRLSLWNSLFLLSFFSNVVPAWLMPSSHLSETVTVLSLRQSVNYSDL